MPHIIEAEDLQQAVKQLRGGIAGARFTVQRGELIRAIQQLAPHMGKVGTGDAEDYQPFGRVRIALDADDRLVLWTGDEQTYAVASLQVVEYLAPQLLVFDVSAEDANGLVKFFKPLGSGDHKDMWFDGLFEISLAVEDGHHRLTVDETFDFPAKGRTVKISVNPMPAPHVDVYPDFPGIITSVLAAGSAPAHTSYPSREALTRILAATTKDGRLRLVESARNALIVGGTCAFTAIVPARLYRSPFAAASADLTAFEDVIDMLRQHERPDVAHQEDVKEKIRTTLHTSLIKATAE